MRTIHTFENVGLQGLPVAHTYICLVDAKNGKLLYRGYTVEYLIIKSTFEETSYLVINGMLPTQSELNEFNSQLKKERSIPEEIIEYLKHFPKESDPMVVLQSALSMLASFDPELNDDSLGSNYRKSIRLISKMPIIIASWDRIRNDLEPIKANNNFSHAENFLYMLKGRRPSPNFVKCLDSCLILHAEHSFNASTFTARVVASTKANIYSAIVAAISALSGPLHGGANDHVIRNLLEIGELKNVEEWVKSKFDNNFRIMGMGHAVYETMDPRAKILEQMLENLARRNGENKFYKIIKEIIRVTQAEFQSRKNKMIYPNVDMFSGCIYKIMGIPIDFYPSIFALSRIIGWAAHILEEKYPQSPLKPVLYRPNAIYKGRYCGIGGCEYVKMENRI
jgi:citrate synthase